MIISIIASASINNVIGKNGKLPWHIPDDLDWFKEKTRGHFVLMGRKTYESISKPLNNRKIIVITRNKSYKIKNYKAEEVYVFQSIKDAINFAYKNGENELFIAGGENIYNQTIDMADKIYLTTVKKHYDGDRFFPKLNKEKYRIIYKEIRDTDPPIEFNILVPTNSSASSQK